MPLIKFKKKSFYKLMIPITLTENFFAVRSFSISYYGNLYKVCRIVY